MKHIYLKSMPESVLLCQIQKKKSKTKPNNGDNNNKTHTLQVPPIHPSRITDWIYTLIILWYAYRLDLVVPPLPPCYFNTLRAGHRDGSADNDTCCQAEDQSLTPEHTWWKEMMENWVSGVVWPPQPCVPLNININKHMNGSTLLFCFSQGEVCRLGGYCTRNTLCAPLMLGLAMWLALVLW